MSRFTYGDSDHVASDDLEAILEYSREVHLSELSNIGSSSRGRLNGNVREDHLRARIAELDAEVHGCRADISAIENRIAVCLHERENLERQLLVQSNSSKDPKGKSREKPGIDYSSGKFDWSEGLKGRMKAVFGIKDFRLCQQGVCNANMDGRDIVCIMPTGGGKSLTYQLPALLTPGCTLVISPLISLMTDQILHLREAKVEAAMITSATSKQDKNQILQRLRSMSEGKPGVETKLAYVTPERMSKDKTFRSILQRLYEAGKLARVVIDEAHCVSQLGHDFRPDYKELYIIRKLFPRVPIMALSATCGPHVLQDLINILGLEPPIDGSNANAQGTVYFSSPLYRKNLHYRVVPKADKAAEHLEAMRDYILDNHPNDTGIIYCFSVKDTNLVAEKLREISNGRIKTGVYNAQIADAEKERLHLAWREGRIKVVCATIAFGLGIDKGDVRFVLHHSISKSLEGFYQESGRAGRDGNDSDCILYYRPQDVSTLAGAIAGEKEGERKLHAILEFAEELRRCRKVQFAEYFSHSSQLSVTSFTTEEVGALENCGHCDNCMRRVDSFERRDVTLATWQTVKILNAICQANGRVTMTKLAALARGKNKGAFDAFLGGRQAPVPKTLDLKTVAGGPVELNQNDMEHFLVHLLTQNYLKEEYYQTAYTCIVYISPGHLAARLNHYNRETIVTGGAKLKLEFDFSTSKKPKSKKTSESSKIPKKRTSTGVKKGKGKAKEGGLGNAEVSDDVDDVEDEIMTGLIGLGNSFGSDDMYASDSSVGTDYDWSRTMRDEPQKKKRRQSNAIANSKGTTIINEGGHDVVVLSD